MEYELPPETSLALLMNDLFLDWLHEDDELVAALDTVADGLVYVEVLDVLYDRWILLN